MLTGLIHVARAKIEKSNSLERAGAHGIEAQSLHPGVECAGEVALVAENPGQKVMGLGESGIPGQAAARDLVRRIQLPSPPQCLAELEKCQTRRLIRETRRQTSYVITHGNSPALQLRSGRPVSVVQPSGRVFPQRVCE